MRLVVDSPAVQHVEQTWPEFRRDPCHLRFGLASDGVSPFDYSVTEESQEHRHLLGAFGRGTSAIMGWSR
ncbi:hypothetical protein R1sor_024336 [Riccia sorocarpa]|uniref:Uncharacterized protein n=1 Tax=Riccia sorocarpa TaxID=122646 RepID=A0ABD3GTF9_9MARC